MCVSLVKAKILLKHQNWRIFSFSSKWSLFSKMFVSSGDIKFFLKKYSLFLKNVRFLWRYFSLVKKYHFMQKVLVFGQRSEFLSTEIKSSRAKLWGKVTSVFLNINICAKTVNFGGKKLKFCEKFWLFQTIVLY